MNGSFREPVYVLNRELIQKEGGTGRLAVGPLPLIADSEVCLRFLVKILVS